MERLDYRGNKIRAMKLNNVDYLKLRDLYKLMGLTNLQKVFNSIPNKDRHMLFRGPRNLKKYPEMFNPKEKIVYLVTIKWAVEASLNDHLKKYLIDYFGVKETKQESTSLGGSKQSKHDSNTMKLLLSDVLNYEGNSIRNVVIDNELYFLSNDVTKILKYSNNTDAIQRHVDKEDRKSLTYKNYHEYLKAFWKTGSDYSDKVVINQFGLYSLILGSQMKTANKFKHWVTHEVLGKIHDTGNYLAPNSNKVLVDKAEYAKLKQISKNTDGVTTNQIGQLLNIMENLSKHLGNQQIGTKA